MKNKQQVMTAKTLLCLAYDEVVSQTLITKKRPNKETIKYKTIEGALGDGWKLLQPPKYCVIGYKGYYEWWLVRDYGK